MARKRQRRKRKKVPLGKPLPPTPDTEDLTPTEDDINAALQWAEKHSTLLADLWRAEVQELGDFD